MKITVIGASGHIGTYLTPMLIREGHEVLAVTRGIARPYADDPLWEKAVRITMDRTQEPDFAEKIAALQADVVIDLINFEREDSEAMVRALKGTSCKQYIFCSSIWVFSQAEVLPVNVFDTPAEPLEPYGRAKLASEIYLNREFEENGFPVTIIRPGQISGPGWDIVGPWGNVSREPFRRIARGEEIFLPNFGMETLHHVHAYDVAQYFCRAVSHRDAVLGKTFEAVSGQSVTLCGYARMLYDFFGKEPKIGFLPWKEWCEYEGDEEECRWTYLHIARSGAYSLDKAKELLDLTPKYTLEETVRQAVQSYADRGLLD